MLALSLKIGKVNENATSSMTSVSFLLFVAILRAVTNGVDENTCWGCTASTVYVSRMRQHMGRERAVYALVAEHVDGTK